MKFTIKHFFSKYDRICKKLRIWSHLLKKSLMENFIFCSVKRLRMFMGPIKNFMYVYGSHRERSLDQAILPLGLSMNTYSYISRFNISMSFVNDKRKVESMIKKNANNFNEKLNTNMLFGPTFEETSTKSLSLKAKSEEFFGTLNQQQ